MTKKEKDLSERQVNILKYIQGYTHDTGRPPTIREIGEACEISSTSVVNYNLTRLQERGLIERSAEVSRGLRVTKPGFDFIGKMFKEVTNLIEETTDYVSSLVNVKIIGDIVASVPLEVGDTSSLYEGEDLQVSSALLPDRTKAEDLFALRVNGDSMIDAMVNEGDLVVMRKANQARNGDMVAVWLTPDDQTTLKYFYHEGDRIRLQPAHPEMSPIYVAPENVQIQGKVVMVVRQLH